MDKITPDPRVYGQLTGLFTPGQLGQILANQGLRANAFCARELGLSHFKFEIVDGVVALDADVETAAEMIRDAGMISAALGRADVRHRFEVIDERDEIVAYLHHDWPASE